MVCLWLQFLIPKQRQGKSIHNCGLKISAQSLLRLEKNLKQIIIFKNFVLLANNASLTQE